MSTPNRVDTFLKDESFVPRAERQFVIDMRKAAAAGVGYGWMQQIIEWEWQSRSSLSWGPETFEAEIANLTKQIQQLTKPT